MTCIIFTRLRQDAPCGSKGRNGDWRPRRSPQGEAGLASAQLRLALSQMPRAEARGASLVRYCNNLASGQVDKWASVG